MSKAKTILFDFDGVIVDTEPLYDAYMGEVEQRYNLGIPDFAHKVKGTPTPDMVKKYFSHLDEEERKRFEEELLEFELNMDFPPIKGALEFLKYLKEQGYKIGLVTSSQRVKMDRALAQLGLVNFFDTEVTADRITQGKPNPMCFLLAAKDLNTPPEDCIVFEDSLNGINAARGAGMKVIGLTTSLSHDDIKDLVFKTFPDLSNISQEVYS